MDSDQRFWVSIWGIIATIIIFGGTILGTCIVRDNARGYAAIQTLIAKGVAPVAAGCAIWGVPGSGVGAAACVIAAGHPGPAQVL